MDLRPIDRRGLGEVVAWTASLVATTIVLLADMMKTGTFDHLLLGLFMGQITALSARGMQSASERSGREDVARQLETNAKAYADVARAAANRAENAATEEFHRGEKK